MLFVQHFSVIWFCILHFLPGSVILLVKIRSIGAVWGCFDFWFLAFCFIFFVWGIFGVCVCVYVCVWVCVYTVESKLENSSIYPPPFPNRNKTNLYICYFSFFFLRMHRINEKWISWILNLRRFYPWRFGFNLLGYCIFNTFLWA